jgi:RNA polymerase sigma-70 factor (ECF subfamily)
MGDSTAPADAELWERAVAGESRAFEQLFDRHADALFAFCVRRTGDRSAAEDLLSTTFLHAWRRRNDVQLTPEGPVPWLYGIATNLVRRHLRSHGRRQAAMARVPFPADEPDPSDAIAGRVDDARRMERIAAALRTMPEGDQELFSLCVWQGLSYGDAAVALGIPVGTVRSRLSRARSRLRLAVGEPPSGGGDVPGEATRAATGRQERSDG